jgi:hypothetical protein
MSLLEKKKKKLIKAQPKVKRGKNDFPAHKFTGKVKFEGDPIEIQRKLRNEWEERLRRY